MARRIGSNFDITAPIIHFRYSGIPGSIKLKDQLYYVKLNDKSPMTHKKSLEEIARMFRREFQYDFIPFCANSKINNDVPFLIWFNDYLRSECVGGFHMVWVDELSNYLLGWVWLHPYIRNKGILSMLWPKLREEFGAFLVEAPLSQTMVAFLRKRNECYRHYKTCPSDCRFLKTEQLNSKAG